MHVGDDHRSPGGIASVVRVHLGRPLRGSIEAIASSRPGPGSWLQRNLPAMRALKVILLTRPSGNLVWHFHLSQRGSLLREGMLLWSAHARGHRRLVVTIHGSSALGRSVLPYRLVTLPATLVHVLSEAHKKWLAAGRAVTVVPNDVVVSAAPLPMQSRPKVVFFAGEVGERKGIDLLLAAWDQAAPPDWRLVIAGPLTRGFVPYQPPRVSFLGPVLHDEVLRHLGASRIAVLPSRAEALPMFVCESMASGCAVIATDVGGTSEMLRGSRFLIPSDDLSALVEAIQQLTSDDYSQEEEGRRNFSYASRTLSTDVVNSKWADLYAAVVYGSWGADDRHRRG